MAEGTNRRMQFKVDNYRDGSSESNIWLLTGTIKVSLDTVASGAIPRCVTYVETRCHRWSSQVERCCLPDIAEKLQLSVFLANKLSLEDWYAGSMAYELFGGRSL